MRLEQFEYLIEVSNTNSINLASEKLHISQQSLSKSLRSLENELGVTLLERTNRGVYLTPNGRKMVEYSRKVITSFMELQQEFTTSAPLNPKEKNGKLSIPITNTIMFSTISKAVRSFNYQYPNIQLLTMEKAVSKVLSDVVEKKSELGLLSLLDNQLIGTQVLNEDFHSLKFTPLIEDRLVVAISSISPLAKHKSISIRSLLKHPLLLLQSENTVNPEYNLLVKTLSQYGTPKFALITNNLDLYFNAILDGSGVGFLTQSSLKYNQILNQGTIITIPIRDSIRIQSGYLTLKDHSLSPIASDFIQFLTQFCAQCKK